MADTDDTPQNAGGSSAALFVRRPILAFVVSALLILAGIGALFGVEVRELPNVASPVVTIRTDFPGASPETVDQEITGRIEGAVGRVEGIRAISSESRFGDSRVTLTFGEGADLDIAAADARDAVARIADQFPQGAEPPRVIKADADAQPIVRVAVTAPGRSPQDLTEIVRDRIEDRMISIEGVADLQIYGDRDPVFRVDIDMTQLASRGLTLADLRGALADVAYDAPAGDLSGGRQTISVRTTATVVTARADHRAGCHAGGCRPHQPWPPAGRYRAACQRPDGVGHRHHQAGNFEHAGRVCGRACRG